MTRPHAATSREDRTRLVFRRAATILELPVSEQFVDSPAGAKTRILRIQQGPHVIIGLPQGHVVRLIYDSKLEQTDVTTLDAFRTANPLAWTRLTNALSEALMGARNGFAFQEDSAGRFSGFMIEQSVVSMTADQGFAQRLTDGIQELVLSAVRTIDVLEAALRVANISAARGATDPPPGMYH